MKSMFQLFSASIESTIAMSLTAMFVGPMVSQAHAQAPRYDMTILGATYNDPANPNKKSKAMGINNNGAIVGEWDYQKPFVWRASTGIQLLQGFPDPNVYNMPVMANKINDNGIITGTYFRLSPCCGQVTHGCVWTSATALPTLLGTLASGNDGFSTAVGINASGRVAGETAVRVYNPIRYAGFQWISGSGMVELGQLPGGDAGSSATGINDNNVVVGNAFIGSDRRATKWSASGVATNLGTLPLGLIGGSWATDINNAGMICGYSFPIPMRACVWQPNSTTPINIGALSIAHQSYANAINNNGVVVGRSNDRAFVWSSQFGMVDINSQIDSLNGHQIVDASDINDNGQIAAIARITINGVQVNRAVLLNPRAGRNCNSVDFNNDGGFYDPMDIAAFLSVYSQGPCLPLGTDCDSIDFNNDGGFYDPTDIAAFLSVYGEGPCL
ncbi:MAG: hypothetical protein U0640_13265 [Phycisphaerales bacterium]